MEEAGRAGGGGGAAGHDRERGGAGGRFKLAGAVVAVESGVVSGLRGGPAADVAAARRARMSVAVAGGSRAAKLLLEASRATTAAASALSVVDEVGATVRKPAVPRQLGAPVPAGAGGKRPKPPMERTDSGAEWLVQLAAASTAMEAQRTRLTELCDKVEERTAARGWECALDAGAVATAKAAFEAQEAVLLHAYAVAATAAAVGAATGAVDAARAVVDRCASVVNREPYVPTARVKEKTASTSERLAAVRSRLVAAEGAFGDKTDAPFPAAALSAARACAQCALTLEAAMAANPRLMGRFPDAVARAEVAVGIADAVLGAGLRKGIKPAKRPQDVALGLEVIAQAEKEIKQVQTDDMAERRARHAAGAATPAASRSAPHVGGLIACAAAVTAAAREFATLAEMTSRTDVADMMIKLAWLCGEEVVEAETAFVTRNGQKKEETFPLERIMWRRSGTKFLTAAMVLKRALRRRVRLLALRKEQKRWAEWENDEDVRAAVTKVAAAVRRNIAMKKYIIIKARAAEYTRRAALTRAAAVKIQRVARGWLSRRGKLRRTLVRFGPFTPRTRARRVEAARSARIARRQGGGPRYGNAFGGKDGIDRHDAAVVLQTLVRGAMARHGLKTLRVQHRAARSIQRIVRGVAGRKRVRNLRVLRAAIQMQRIIRGRKCRNLLDVLRLKRVFDAAAKIQAMARMRAARVAAGILMVEQGDDPPAGVAAAVTVRLMQKAAEALQQKEEAVGPKDLLRQISKRNLAGTGATPLGIAPRPGMIAGSSFRLRNWEPLDVPREGQAPTKDVPLRQRTMSEAKRRKVVTHRSVEGPDGSLLLQAVLVDAPPAGTVKLRRAVVAPGGLVSSTTVDVPAPQPGFVVRRVRRLIRGVYVEEDDIRPAPPAGLTLLRVAQRNGDGSISVVDDVVPAPGEGEVIMRVPYKLPDGNETVVQIIAPAPPPGSAITRVVKPLIGGTADLVDVVVPLPPDHVVLRDTVNLPDGTTGYVQTVVPSPDGAHAVVRRLVANPDGSIGYADRVVPVAAGKHVVRVELAQLQGPKDSPLAVDLIEDVYSQKMLQWRNVVVEKSGKMHCETVLVDATVVTPGSGEVVMRLPTVGADGRVYYVDKIQKRPGPGKVILRESAVDADGLPTFGERVGDVPREGKIILRRQRNDPDGNFVVDDVVVAAPRAGQAVMRQVVPASLCPPGAGITYAESIVDVPPGYVVVRAPRKTASGSTVYEDVFVPCPAKGTEYIRRPRTDVDGRETYESVLVGPGVTDHSVPRDTSMVIVPTVTLLPGGGKQIDNLVDTAPGARARVVVVHVNGDTVTHQPRYDDVDHAMRRQVVVKDADGTLSFLELYAPEPVEVDGGTGPRAMRVPISLKTTTGQPEYVDPSAELLARAIAEFDAEQMAVTSRSRSLSGSRSVSNASAVLSRARSSSGMDSVGRATRVSSNASWGRGRVLSGAEDAMLRESLAPFLHEGKSIRELGGLKKLNKREVWRKAIMKIINRGRACRVWGTAEACRLMRVALFTTFRNFDVVKARVRKGRGFLSGEFLYQRRDRLVQRARSQLSLVHDAMAIKEIRGRINNLPGAMRIIILIQAAWRGRKARKRAAILRHRARMWAERAASRTPLNLLREDDEQRAAAVMIQAAFRGYMVKKEYLAVRAEVEAEMALEAEAREAKRAAAARRARRSRRQEEKAHKLLRASDSESVGSAAIVPGSSRGGSKVASVTEQEDDGPEKLVDEVEHAVTSEITTAASAVGAGSAATAFESLLPRPKSVLEVLLESPLTTASRGAATAHSGSGGGSGGTPHKDTATVDGTTGRITGGERTGRVSGTVLSLGSGVRSAAQETVEGSIALDLPPPSAGAVPQSRLSSNSIFGSISAPLAATTSPKGSVGDLRPPALDTGAPEEAEPQARLPRPGAHPREDISPAAAAPQLVEPRPQLHPLDSPALGPLISPIAVAAPRGREATMAFALAGLPGLETNFSATPSGSTVSLYRGFSGASLLSFATEDLGGSVASSAAPSREASARGHSGALPLRRRLMPEEEESAMAAAAALLSVGPLGGGGLAQQRAPQPPPRRQFAPPSGSASGASLEGPNVTDQSASATNSDARSRSGVGPSARQLVVAGTGTDDSQLQAPQPRAAAATGVLGPRAPAIPDRRTPPRPLLKSKSEKVVSARAALDGGAVEAALPAASRPAVAGIGTAWGAPDSARADPQPSLALLRQHSARGPGHRRTATEAALEVVSARSGAGAVDFVDERPDAGLLPRIATPTLEAQDRREFPSASPVVAEARSLATGAAAQLQADVRALSPLVVGRRRANGTGLWDE